MTENTYSISEIREIITQLPKQFAEGLKMVTVTRHGKPVMEIVPAELSKNCAKPRKLF